MKPGGKDGKLYKIVKETVVEGGIDTALEKSGFYRILAVGSSSSLPQPSSEAVAKGARALGAGDVTHLWKCQELASGDRVALLELVLIGFVKDVSNSKQGTSYDVSTQENLDSGNRAWITGAFTDSNGTINGTFETDSDAQRGGELLGLQFALTESFGGVLCPLVDFDCALCAEGGVYHVLHLVEVRCHADGGFSEFDNLLDCES